MSFPLAIGRSLWQSSLQEDGEPDVKGNVNFNAIIVSRSGAMSVKPC